MEVILIRHADAEAAETTDFARVLTAKGHRQAQRVGSFLAAQGIVVNRLMTSPLVRAVETAEHLQLALNMAADATVDERLACGMTPQEAYGILRECESAGDAGVIMVGHEPDFSGFAADATSMESYACIEVKKASVIIFDLEYTRRGGARLRALIPPKMLP